MAEELAAKDVSLAGGASESDVPAGYKRTDAGVIPEDWCTSSVGAEFTVQLGKMLDGAKNIGTPKPYIGNRSVQWGRIGLQDIATVLMTPSDVRRFRLKRGDLLVCEGGEVGRAAIWNDPIPECYYQKALYRLRPKGSYVVQLMMAQLQLWASTEYLANYVTQTSIAHLPKDKLELIPLPVPLANEQRAIAEALSDVDGLVESLETLIAKKRAVETATMQQLLTGRTRLPGFSGEWRTRQVLDVADVDPENLSNDTKPDFVFNYISLEQVVSGRLLGYSEEKFCTAPSRARRVLRYGDVLMSTVRPGLMAHLLYRDQIPNAICSTGFAVLRPKTKLCDPGFLFSHLLGHVVNRQIQNALAGSNYPAISGRDVGRLEIPFPSRIQEQRAIAATLSDMDAELTALENRLDKVRALKQGMMQQLLTGRIRLPATDRLAKGQAESVEGEPVGAAPGNGGET